MDIWTLAVRTTWMFDRHLTKPDLDNKLDWQQWEGRLPLTALVALAVDSGQSDYPLKRGRGEYYTNWKELKAVPFCGQGRGIDRRMDSKTINMLAKRSRRRKHAAIKANFDVIFDLAAL